MLFPDGPLQGESCGEKAHAAIKSKAVHISILGADINQTRQSTPIICGEITLVNLNILDGIGNYGTKEAKQVGRIIDGGLIDRDQVLIPSPSSYKENGGPVSKKVYSGDGSQGFDHILLPEQGWHIPDSLWSELSL